jgi:sec-independent protein translocase protein TatA
VVKWVQVWTFPIESEVAMTCGVLFGFLGPSNPIVYVVVALVAFLLFGNRLPSVMRSLGRSVVEFKKGVAGIEDDIDEAVRSADDKVKTEKKDSEA